MSNLDNLRVSEADREEASARLAEHYSTGRLTDDDYYERLDAVWSAKVRADLEMLFTDLPKSAPQPQAVRRPRRGRPRAFPLVACFLLVAIGLVVMGVPWWIFAAIAGGALLFRKGHHRSRSCHQQMRHSVH
jgi:Flp pilus assembly protein TadB